MRKLRKIHDEFNSDINRIAKRLLKVYNKSLKYRYKGYVADTVNGRAYTDGYQFTVPLWAYDKGKDYFTYYIAHELSHQIHRLINCDKKGKHDRKFYEIFMKLCPSKLQYFELEYKKTAAKYGIGRK